MRTGVVVVVVVLVCLPCGENRCGENRRCCQVCVITAHADTMKVGSGLRQLFAFFLTSILLFVACSDEYWQAHPELANVPVLYASSLAQKCMTVYHVRNPREIGSKDQDLTLASQHSGNSEEGVEKTCSRRKVVETRR